MKGPICKRRKITWLHLLVWIMTPMFLMTTVPPAVLADTASNVAHAVNHAARQAAAH